MSYSDANRTVPFGAITIFRAANALTDAVDLFRATLTRRATTLGAFNPAQLEDIGLSIADVETGREGIAGRVAAAVGRWNARRRTVNELSRLSDAQLDDIGLTRAHIESMRFGHPLM